MARLCKACLLVFFAFPAISQDSNLRVAVPLLAFGSHHQPTSISVESLVITDQKVPVTGADLLPGANLPLELGVMIDTSPSQRGANLDEVLKTINRFVAETIRSPEDKVFFLTFSEGQHMTEWLRKDQLQSRPPVKLGLMDGTAFYDALAAACQQRMGPRNWAKPTRRVLVVVSDGIDNRSQLTGGQAVSEALKAGAVIFTIDPVVIGVVSKGDKMMTSIAEQTGGESFDGVGWQEIPKVFASIQELIKGMYYLRYLPPSTPNDEFHKVEVKAAPKEKLRLAYARKYFWNP